MVAIIDSGPSEDESGGRRRNKVLKKKHQYRLRDFAAFPHHTMSATEGKDHFAIPFRVATQGDGAKMTIALVLRYTGGTMGSFAKMPFSLQPLRCNESRTCCGDGSERYDRAASTVDAITMEPLEPRHVEWISPDGNLKVCYNLSTIFRCASADNHLQQPPHFRGRMSADMHAAIKRDFPKEYTQFYAQGVRSRFTNSDIDSAIERHRGLLNWGRDQSITGDLYCCPICYCFLHKRKTSSGQPDAGQFEEQHVVRHDPLVLLFDTATALSDSGDLQAMNSVGCMMSSSLKLMKSHLRDCHGLKKDDLVRAAGCDALLKRFRIRDADALVQQYWAHKGWRVSRILRHTPDRDDKAHDAAASSFGYAQDDGDDCINPITKRYLSKLHASSSSSSSSSSSGAAAASAPALSSSSSGATAASAPALSSSQAAALSLEEIANAIRVSLKGSSSKAALEKTDKKRIKRVLRELLVRTQDGQITVDHMKQFTLGKIIMRILPQHPDDDIKRWSTALKEAWLEIRKNEVKTEVRFSVRFRHKDSKEKGSSESSPYDDSIRTTEKLSVQNYWGGRNKLIYLRFAQTVKEREQADLVTSSSVGNSSSSSTGGSNSSSSSSSSSSRSSGSITSTSSTSDTNTNHIFAVWEKLVENHAQISDFAHDNVVEFFRGLVYPFSTRANDDDRDAIVSDVSDDEGVEGMSMHAAFDQSREAVGKMLRPFLNRGYSRDDDDEDDDDDDYNDDLDLGQKVHVKYDGEGDTGVYVAHITEIGRKTVTVCYEVDKSIETIPRWALTERIVHKHIKKKQKRKRERQSPAAARSSSDAAGNQEKKLQRKQKRRQLVLTDEDEED